MAGVIAEAWRGSFTSANDMAAFKGAGLWPVNMKKAINRLHSKRKQRANDRPIPEDLTVVASKKQLEEDLGHAALLELKRQGVMIEGLRVETVFLGGLTHFTKRSKSFATVRAGGEKPESGLLSSEEHLAKARKDKKEKEAAENVKADNAKARTEARAAREANLGHGGRCSRSRRSGTAERGGGSLASAAAAVGPFSSRGRHPTPIVDL
ncbi:unnamed protein product [Ectocarpus sp. CCAP 1310/34]|nr:unnamed protein product [Ectocarpus sp. CCAP 1310/34]